MGYDLIGDVHGQADALVALLGRLGYRERGGTWGHPDRQAIFVGDLIDRGPNQRETVELVRRMVDAGRARCVMGNHEFNAIAWHTEDPDAPGRFLRPRVGEAGAKNRRQHAAFLAEVEDRPALHREYVAFFLEMPLWIDEPGLRVVHACWQAAHMAAIAPRLAPGRRLTRGGVVAACRKGRPEFVALESLTKGLEVPLPDGQRFVDADGHERRSVRIRWWDPGATTYRTAALLDEERAVRLPEAPLPAGVATPCDDDRPVFFGHYWLTGAPRPLTPRAACLDYSAGRGGPLVAYRWDGEPVLDAARFTSDR